MLQKFLLIPVFSMFLLLSGCTGEDDVSIALSDTYTHDLFSIGLLSNWRVIEPQDFVNALPKETLIAFSDSTDPERNITIIKENLSSAVTSAEYAEANILNAKKKVVDYSLIQIEDVSVSNQDTKIIVFKGRLSAQHRLLKYIQTYITKENQGFVITGVVAPDASQDLITVYKLTIQTFTLTE